MKPIADDDTPPPAERPLIRQSLAFAGIAPQVPNAYQAQPASSATTSSPLFLPGQEVAPAQPSKRTKKPAGQKVKHYDDNFASQTTRWRASTYDHTSTSDVPPVYSGKGPYNSLFRAENFESPHRASPSPSVVASTSSVGQTYTPGPPPEPQPTSSASASQNAESSTSSGPRNSKVARTSKPKAPSTRKKGPKPSAGTSARVIKHAAASTTDTARSSTAVSSPGDGRDFYQSPPPLPTSTSAQHSHYRSQGRLDLPAQASTRNLSMTRSASPVMILDPSPPQALMELPPVSAHQPLRQTKNTDRSQKPPLLLTMLITDRRQPVEEFQLVELRVKLRPDLDPANGWWAEAEQICEEIQNGPSRIDGPARMYTLRGKFRQYILRVDERNEWVTKPSNVSVSPDRSVEAFIESLPLPASLRPQPPQVPPRMLQRPPSPIPNMSLPPSPTLPTRHRVPPRGYAPSERQNFHDVYPPSSHRKRPRSPSFDHYDDDHRYRPADANRFSTPGTPSSLSSAHFPHSQASYDYSQHVTPPRMSNKGLMGHNVPDSRRYERDYGTPLPLAGPSGHPGSDSPSEPDDEMLDEETVKSLTDLIQHEDGWIDFFKSKGRTATASEVLNQYRFVQRLVDTWVGKEIQVRPGPQPQVVQKTHVLRSLFLDDKWGADCTETLDLLALYGPDGERFKSRRTMEILDDLSQPEYNAKPIKRLLHALRDADRDWRRDNPPAESSGRRD
ncbi:hypothetical protein HGRIS_002637 [Hohenbuehelia grisea]